MSIIDPLKKTETYSAVTSVTVEKIKEAANTMSAAKKLYKSKLYETAIEAYYNAWVQLDDAMDHIDDINDPSAAEKAIRAVAVQVGSVAASILLGKATRSTINAVNDARFEKSLRTQQAYNDPMNLFTLDRREAPKTYYHEGSSREFDRIRAEKIETGVAVSGSAAGTVATASTLVGIKRSIADRIERMTFNVKFMLKEIYEKAPNPPKIDDQLELWFDHHDFDITISNVEEARRHVEEFEAAKEKEEKSEE